MMPAAKTAAQHPARNTNHKAGTVLKVSVLSQAHQPSTTLHSGEHMPHNHQQAAECTLASVSEAEVAPASTAIHQQPQWEDNRSSPFTRSLQLALPDLSADNTLKPASVKNVTPGSNLASTQDADVSMQPDLRVKRLESPQEALLGLDLQQADAVGSMSQAIHKETLQDNGHQTAQPSCNVADKTFPQSDPFGNAHTLQDADGVEPDNALMHSGRDISASGALQIVADTALPAGEAQSGSRTAIAALSRGPEVADLIRRKPFSWRKRGRSWRRMTSKE